MPLNIDAYFYKDFGASHFGNFTHFIDFYLDAVGGSSTSIAGYGVGTSVDDMNAQTDALGVYWSGSTSPERQINIRDLADDDIDFTALLALDTTYYLKVIRTGTAWSCEIYTGGREDTLADTIAITGTATAFRYLFAAWSYNVAAGARDITGWMENLDLQEGAPAANAPTSALWGPLGGALYGPIQ